MNKELKQKINKENQTAGRFLTGVVIADKMNKTRVIEVVRIKKHPKYQRRFKVFKKYKAHDENNEHKVGDKVIIRECRPMSKEKKWVVVKKI